MVATRTNKRRTGHCVVYYFIVYTEYPFGNCILIYGQRGGSHLSFLDELIIISPHVYLGTRARTVIFCHFTDKRVFFLGFGGLRYSFTEFGKLAF